ncbi:MAG: AraC family transcriptional regulator [Spirochaetaceae bacterium]|jgi:AraC-like DNA-binding protein|nr:AraC family transcriptional regulator [Spirochaetaceae bacterium]
MRSKTWESFLHYLPFSEEDEKLGMVCTTAGCIEVAPRTEYPPDKHKHPALFRLVAEGRILPEFQAVYVTKGEGVFGVAGNTYKVIPGSLMIILPGMKHFYKPVYEIGWHEYWVGFKGQFFSRLMQEGFLSEHTVFFNIGLQDYSIALFNQILDEIRTQRPLYQFKACSGVLSLLAETLTRERRQEQPNYYQKIVEKAKYLMESNMFSVIDIPSISEQIGISASRLNEIFKTYTSMTPYQYYIHIKIHKAESLLEQDETTVKEVAYSLGFEDQYYFSRLFKNKTGVVPSRWKKFVLGR